MEHSISAVDEFGHQLRVANVADDDLDLARDRHRVGEILGPSAYHVVDDNDLGAARIDEQIDDVRADEAGAAGDEHTLALQQIGLPGRNGASQVLHLKRHRLSWHVNLPWVPIRHSVSSRRAWPAVGPQAAASVGARALIRRTAPATNAT